MKTFTATCNKPYDRHTYKLIFKDGTEMEFEDYATARYEWFQWKDRLDTMVVVSQKSKGGEGF